MKRAFTLIELLVVIAIIAILAAILFPVFAQAKEAAKATQVLSNMKQICTAEQLYIGDADDTMPSYITRTEVAANPPFRDDIVSWVQQFAPYVKNGTPIRPTSATATGIKPEGMFNSPTWSQEKWIKGANTADCDGQGALDSWVPLTWIHAHFGISFGVTNALNSGVWAGNYDANAGTQDNPVYYFAGSYLPYRASSPNAGLNTTMSATSIQRPAETAFVTDGFTGVIKTGGFGTTMGCEGQFMYKGGGNAGFTDGHAKFYKGNLERYLAQDGSGKWYKRFFTIDR